MLSLEYIAGLFDGEGMVRLNRVTKSSGTYYSLVTRIKMTDESLILELKDFIGRGSVYKETPPGNCKPCWSLTLSSQDALAFLIDIKPYLRTKSKVADLGIQYQTSLRDRGNKGGLQKLTDQEKIRRKYFFDRIGELNKRGKE